MGFVLTNVLMGPGVADSLRVLSTGDAEPCPHCRAYLLTIEWQDEARAAPPVTQQFENMGILYYELHTPQRCRAGK